MKKQKIKVVWEEPGERQYRGGRQINPIFEVTRANPGRWAVAGTYKTHSLAGTNTARWRKLFPDHEIVQRIQQNGQVRIYVRFVGGRKRLSKVARKSFKGAKRG